MAGGIWDSNLKQLVAAYPQHFVTWLMQGAYVLGELSTHFNVTADADTLYEIGWQWAGEREGFHLEWQRYRDPTMAERVWEYNVLASRRNNCVVHSFVLYVKKDGNVVEPPLIKHSASGQEIHRFSFQNIKLWEVPTDEIRQLGLVGLYPLLPLTREGAKPEVVEEVVTQVETIPVESTRKSLLSITLTLAGLALESKDEKEWLIRRFRMYQDILKESYIYQLIKEESIEEERRKDIQVLRNMVLGFFQSRFADLLPLASSTVAQIESKDLLQELASEVGQAKTEEEARRALTKAHSQ